MMRLVVCPPGVPLRLSKLMVIRNVRVIYVWVFGYAVWRRSGKGRHALSEELRDLVVEIYVRLRYT